MAVPGSRPPPRRKENVVCATKPSVGSASTDTPPLVKSNCAWLPNGPLEKRTVVIVVPGLLAAGNAMRYAHRLLKCGQMCSGGEVARRQQPNGFPPRTAATPV